jgi:rhamnose utilization protein RhaD (predicted bifunctional aldolase and dehydrogenase)/NAD(P)-dependent dehydrogenase (short-subunit alcohol dehydrogenase family)
VRDRWSDAVAPDAADPLGQCVYGSRLLGSEPTVVLHGGGNTSVKTTVDDLTGPPIEVLYVKGSGSDLASIERAGFTALRMARLTELLRLERLADAQMMNELRCARLDASAPDPSVESLLHALLPHPAVQHSHADALIALTNQPDPQALVRQVFGARVFVVPYVMPGFDLARLAATMVPRPLPPQVDGLVLCNHGLFTFGDTTEKAYQRHIALIGLAEEFLADHAPARRGGRRRPRTTFTALDQARLRRRVCDVAGAPMVVSRRDDAAVHAFVARADLAAVATRGPLTPDHVIRTKRVPLVGQDAAGYAGEYEAYFAAHRDRRGVALQMLDPAPRILLDPAFGLLSVGRRAVDADIAAEVYAHTIDVIEAAEAVGRYQALPPPDIFDVEYWELEQAKLRRAGDPPPFAGEVALVTGAASGIGRACVAALRSRGAAVIGLDLNPATDDDAPDLLNLRVDITDPAGVDAAIERGVARFGGVDLLVACAGIFPPSQRLAELDPQQWRRTMAVNVDSVAALFSRLHPVLALAFRGARVVLVASKNVPAPGPGAAAYSASKAALTQLARVAALEWAGDGIRVNVVHPDAVFDTGLWTEELLCDRATRYGLSVAEYKRRNPLSMEVTSARVAEVVAALCGDAFLATTGAQVSVDGGSERVI